MNKSTRNSRPHTKSKYISLYVWAYVERRDHKTSPWNLDDLAIMERGKGTHFVVKRYRGRPKATLLSERFCTNNAIDDFVFYWCFEFILKFCPNYIWLT